MWIIFYSFDCLTCSKVHERDHFIFMKGRNSPFEIFKRLVNKVDLGVDGRLTNLPWDVIFCGFHT